MSFHKLYSKYDVQAPRYTSYPTVPYWDTSPTKEQWIAHLRAGLQASQSSWSAYVHIPFCETLCTFCGCNTSITKDHGRESGYVKSLTSEWMTYLQLVPELCSTPIRQLHLGGGTPTFLSPESLRNFLKAFFKSITKDPHHFEGAIEVDPRRTTVEQLEALREFDFSRVSMGVQDFDPDVQRLVNRIQPFSITAQLTKDARRLGYQSVNFDLIYGLAKQTAKSIRHTAEQTVELRPDRIALYSFALVPWIKPAQRLFKDEDLPVGEQKRELYEIAREVLLTNGYVEVGMDHFALENDGLAKALKQGRLHRNFMGYTDVKTDVLLGLGVSAISESPWSFHQNEKILSKYEDLVAGSSVPSFRGHVLTNEDRERREQILQFMTTFEVRWSSQEQFQEASEYLAEMIRDGLVKVDDDGMRLTELGRPFLRNACLFFDQRLRSQRPQTPIFSKSI